MNIIFAYLHSLALAVGFAGVLLRGHHLKNAEAGGSVRGLLFADNLWGAAAMLWLTTGLVRVFSGFEKGAEFYLQSHWFWLKMILFLFVWALEILPMVTFIKWRIRRKEKFSQEDLSLVRLLYRINLFETGLVLLIPLIAAAMARNL